MNVLGIIAEYNPFHNGHLYHLKKAKKKTNADFVIVIMSGSFTQQGNISVLSKFERASLAVKYGADLVIELPTIYATSSSENFCYGAVNILNSLGCVTHLAFGAECKYISLLKSIAEKLLEKHEEIIALSKSHSRKGITVANCRDLALKALLDPKEYLEISKSNNILGLEYLKALYTLNSSILPVIIERKAVEHNEKLISKDKNIASATSIRKTLASSVIDFELIKSFVPSKCFEVLNSSKILSNESFFDMLKYEILKLGSENIANVYEVAEGLENKIYKAALTSNSYDELLLNIKSKRYTLGRIKRILVYILLGITKEFALDLSQVEYARILKISKNGKLLLKDISKKSYIPVLSNISEKHIQGLHKVNLKSLDIDVLSSNILSTLRRENLNSDYTNLIDNV